MTELLLTLPMAADAIVYDRWQATLDQRFAQRRTERLKHSNAAKLSWKTRRARAV